MSAITKPCLTFADAIDPTQLVPVEAIQTMDDWDTPALSNPLKAAETGLIFTLIPPYTQPIKVLFSNSTDRDAAKTAALAAISTAV